VTNPAGYRVVWQDEQPGPGFYSWYFEKDLGGGNWTSELSDSEISQVFTTEFDFGTFDPRTFGGVGSPQGPDPVVWN
jgi:hypothetical protein